MGRAIIIAALVVLCSFGFVLVQLARNRPRGAMSSGPGQILQTREDGSVYAVSVQLRRFEQRLFSAEERSQKLAAEVEALRKERDGLSKQVQNLAEEVQQLRKDVDTKPAPPAVTPGNAPVLNGPVTPAPVATPPGSPE